MRVVGRSSEVARVRAADDRGRAVLVVGPAGIGKSAMVHHALRARPTLEGVAVDGLRWRALMPLSMAIGRQLTGRPDVVADEVARHVGERTLVIEDLHWADPATLAVLERVAGAVRLVATMRDGAPPPGWAAEAEIVALGPLRERVARPLVERLHPGLSRAARDELLRAADGNPLLLAELVVDERPTPTLLAAARARLSALPPATAELVVEVALLARPVEAQLLGVDTATVPGLLVTGDDGLVRPTHALVAEAALAALDDEARRAAHRRLADKLAAPDAAAHLLAAGDAADALAAARTGLAAEHDPSRRAHLLSIAAAAADDDDLRLEAATALIAVADVDGAARAAEAVTSHDPQVRAEAALRRGQSRWFAGEPLAARELLAAGIALVTGTGTPTEARLCVEDALQRVRSEEGSGVTTAIAEAALDVAERASTDVTRARLVVAIARAHDRADGWDDAFRAVIEAAAAEGDGEIECAASFFRASHLGFQGRMAEAIDELARMVPRAGALGQVAWQTHMRAAGLTNRLLVGDRPSTLSREAAAFAADAPRFRNVAQVRLVELLSLGDEDRAGDVRTTAAAVLRLPLSEEDRSILEAAEAESAWLVGDHATAVARAEAAVRRGRGWFGIDAGAVAAGAHALVELERPVPWRGPTHGAAPLFRMLAAEVDVLARVAGSGGAGLDDLDAFAGRWDAVGVPRYAVRLRWIAALRAVHHQHPSAARRLRDVERVARERGWLAIAGRAASASEPLARHATVTAREADVLRCVASGASSASIAAALGIGGWRLMAPPPPAPARLGAPPRGLAAAMLAAGPRWLPEPSPGSAGPVQLADLPGEPFSLDGLVVSADVDDDATAAAALLAAARGATVVASFTVPPEAAARIDDELRRLAGRRPQRAPALADAHVELLAELAAGATVTEAARRLGRSRRTATRQLAAACAALGVSSTAEAVVAMARARHGGT